MILICCEEGWVRGMRRWRWCLGGLGSWSNSISVGRSGESTGRMENFMGWMVW
jgi:hypothetical protein